MEHQLIKFTDIFGQAEAIEALTTAYKLERLPHALIFAGPSGVGKGTTARALAGLFLCEKPSGANPCGKCESCRSFDAGTNPDLHIVHRLQIRLLKSDSAARDLSIDVIREFLIAKAMKTSVGGVGKVFVVEEADRMSTGAQNSLLKVLEEPAKGTLIILLTDQPEYLLSTIRSRSRQVRFGPLDPKVVRAQLEKRGISKDLAAAAAGMTEGSLGLALEWIGDGVIEQAQQLFQLLGQIVEGKGAMSLQSFLKAASDGYSELQIKRDKQASADQSKRAGLNLYLKLAGQYLRSRLPEFHNDPDGLQRLCDGIDVLVKAEGYVDSNVTLAIVLQQVAVAMDRAVAGSA